MKGSPVRVRAPAFALSGNTRRYGPLDRSMRQLARRLSVVLVVGVALAAFVTALLPRDDTDARRHASRPSSSTIDTWEPTDEKLFVADGYSFAYPASWAKGRERVTDAGRVTTAFAWDAPTAISPSTSGEALVVVAEPLSERDFDPYLRLIRGRLRNEGERLLESPTHVTLAGLPAFRSAVEFPDGAVRRYTVIVGRRRAYFLTCTFLSEEMERGCDRVEESFRVE
jgi:hypothetical protein